MIESSNVIAKPDFAIELAKKSKKYIMFVRAEGPLNCKDLSKLEEIWNFYSDKMDPVVFNDLKQYGEVYIYFDGKDYPHECMEEWFVPKRLLEDGEYDLDMDYYFYVEITGPNGEGMGFN